MSTDDFDTLAPGDEEVFAGLRRSVGGATLPAGAADVVALGRRTRNRHRAVAAGIGTGAAALVAAIGVLAPSAGTGAGTNAAGRGIVAPTSSGKPAATPGGAQPLDIQEAGFSLKEQGDGTLDLAVKDLLDPAVLQSVLDKAGVPSVILVQEVPAGWDYSLGLRCTPEPGVRYAGNTVSHQVLRLQTAADPNHIVIDKSAIPAGDYLTLVQFQTNGQPGMTSFGLNVGRQTTCVPQHFTKQEALQEAGQ